MNAQQLKNAILQEAITGRLVPQDPNDEPASVLLEKIRVEKKRLVKEGKLKKKDLEEKTISEDEKPFEIPESWEWVRLSNVAYFFNGDRSKNYPNKNEYVSHGVAWINTGHIEPNGYLTTSYMNYITEDKYNSLSSGKIEKGDLVYCLRGATYGKVAKVEPYEKGAVASSLMIIRLLNVNIRDYIFAYLKSPFSKDQLLNFANGAAQPNLAAKDVSKYLVPLPPLAEQHRIVAKIEELLPKVEEYGKAQEALNKLNEELPERLKKSILQEAIEGRLVPQDPNDEPASVLLEKIRKEKAKLVKEGKLKKKDLEETPIIDDEKPFEIPKSWEWCKIGTIFQHSSGKQLCNGDNEGELHQYITTSNLYWDKFVLDGLKSMHYKSTELERCKAIKGDLLVCEGGDVGRSAIWPFDYDIYLQNHVHRLRLYKQINTRFVMYIFMLYKAKGEIGGKGIGIKGLSASALKDINIPLPPLAEQHRIVEKIEQLVKEIDKLKTK